MIDGMISNHYIALLDQDTILIKHPKDNDKTVKLYRIIALKTFRLTEFDKTIEKGTIGGFIEGLHNVDPDAPVWIANRARVFDDAKILHGSYISDSAVIFGNAQIKASRIKNYARAYGNVNIVESTISDLAEIKDNATLVNCNINNSAMVFNDANLTRCSLNIGSCARGNVIAIDTKLNNTTQIGGNARLINCELFNDAKVFDGRHDDKIFDDENELVYEVFDGNINDLQPVEFKFEGQTYNGYAWLIPGKSRSLVYSDMHGKEVLKTKLGMNLTVTAEELFNKPVF